MHDPANPTAESEPSHTGMGDDAGAHRETEKAGFPVEVSEQHTRLHSCRRTPALGLDRVAQ
jgi:hypothetical protein